MEEFIAIKGIKALGNQLTSEKVNAVNLLDPIPFTPPEEIPAQEIEVVDEETLENLEQDEQGIDDSQEDIKPGEGGQTSLF